MAKDSRFQIHGYRVLESVVRNLSCATYQELCIIEPMRVAVQAFWAGCILGRSSLFFFRLVNEWWERGVCGGG